MTYQKHNDPLSTMQLAQSTMTCVIVMSVLHLTIAAAVLGADRYRALNVQAGCQFCDRAFEREVASGRLSSSMLDKYSCVALAGVVTEYLKFGQAEGGVGDVAQLDRLFQALQVGDECGADKHN